MFCQNCGNRVEDNSMFCPNCGAKVENQPATSGFEQPQAQNAAPYQNNGMVNNIAPYPNNGMVNNAAPYPNNGMVNNTSPYPNNGLPQKKKSKAVPIVISIILALIVVAAIILVIVLTSDKNDDNKTTTTQGTKETTTEETTTEEETTEKETTTEEETTEEETTTEDIPEDGNYIVDNNVEFEFPEEFEKNSSIQNNYVRFDEAGLEVIESVYYNVQIETLYSKEEMIEAYERSIESVYGTEEEKSTYTVGDIELTAYSFETGVLKDGYVSKVYLYSDGNTTFYIESLIKDGEATMIEDILDTLVIN